MDQHSAFIKKKFLRQRASIDFQFVFFNIEGKRYILKSFFKGKGRVEDLSAPFYFPRSGPISGIRRLEPHIDVSLTPVKPVKHGFQYIEELLRSFVEFRYVPAKT